MSRKPSHVNNKCYIFAEIPLKNIPKKSVVARMRMEATFKIEMGTPGSPEHSEMEAKMITAVSKSLNTWEPLCNRFKSSTHYNMIYFISILFCALPVEARICEEVPRVLLGSC